MYLMQMFVLSKQGLRIGDLERYKDVMPTMTSRNLCVNIL